MSHVWPLGYEAVYTSPREYRAGMWLQDGSWLPESWHYGCDWAGTTGTPVRAAHDGTLQNLVEPNGAGNYCNIVAYDKAHRTMYMHLDGFARSNGPVAAGDVIGYVGSTGASTGPHLHFQVHQPATGWPSVEPVAWLILSDLDRVPAQVYQWCHAHGLSDAGAAGIMGNLQAESLMDPAIVEGMTHDPSDLVPGVREGLGLLQWSYDRRERLVAYAHGERRRPWQQPEVQLDFLDIEVSESAAYRAMWDRLKVHTDPAAASGDFATTFVRPGVYGARDDYAVGYHARILAGEFGTPDPTPVPPYVPVHLDIYPAALGGDMATLIIDVEGGPADVHPVWEYTGGVLRPFLDASLAGDFDRQKRSWGTFVGLYGDYLKINRIRLDGVPVEQQLRDSATAALAKFNGTA